MQTTALLWLANQAIPVSVVSLVALLQGTSMSDLPAIEKEGLTVLAQALQLAATLCILKAATAPHQPLPEPWFSFRLDGWGAMVAGAAAISALGGGVLLAAAMSRVPADGVAEWREMLSTSDASSAAILGVGAVLLAPVTEELLFRGYVLPSLTKWMHPAAAVALSSCLFAAAHPPGTFVAQLMLGVVLGAACVASRGNLMAPTLGHAAYNGLVVTAAVLLAVNK